MADDPRGREHGSCVQWSRNTRADVSVFCVPTWRDMMSDRINQARVAKSADAEDLKSSVLRDVWVRVPPRAPSKDKLCRRMDAAQRLT